MLSVCALAIAVCAGLVSPAAAQSPSAPHVMAAIGDSYTAACTAVPAQDCATSSWSVGEGPSINSHLQRLRARVPELQGQNFAIAGRKMAALDLQARLAVGTGADYVTILMGTNDVCREPTPQAKFRDDFVRAMDTLSAGLPAARIFVASIPDPGHLRDLFRDDPAALMAWASGGQCLPFLANAASEAPADQQRRLDAHDHVAALNDTLAEVCASYAGCVFDGNAVFRWKPQREDIAADYFHFSARGEAALAALTYPVAFAGRPPAKLSVRRASIRAGKLDALVRITGLATGRIQVSFAAAGRRTTFSRELGPIQAAEKQIRILGTLARRQRRARTGVLTVIYFGASNVQPEILRSRAANASSALRATQLSLTGTRLIAAGTLRQGLGGPVRLRVTYTSAEGTLVAWQRDVRVVNGRWASADQLPAAIAADPNAYLTIQYTGSGTARGGPYRGEQLGKSLATPPAG